MMTYLNKYILFIGLLFPLYSLCQTELSKNEFLLKGQVIDQGTKYEISSAKIRIIGIDSTEFELKSDSTGSFRKELKCSVNYIIIVSAKGYLKAKGREGGYHGSPVRTHLYELEEIGTCSGLIPLMTYNLNEVNDPFDPSEPDIKVIDYLFQILQDNPTLKVELIGYRDKIELENTSIKRAKNAVGYLIQKGISSRRIYPIDGGLDKTITDYKRNSDLNPTKVTHNRMLILKIVAD